MKTKILVPVVSVVLFLGSMLGLLAMQGRLNYAGTRGVPILSMFFHAPPEGAKDAAGTAPDAKAGSEGEPKAATQPSDDGKAHDASGHDPQSNKGESGTAPATQGQDANHGTSSGAAGETSPREETKDEPVVKVPATFRYPEVPSKMTAEELNAVIAAVELDKRKLAQERTQLGYEREALAIRERDVEERRKQVRNDMISVESMSGQLETRLKAFESQTALLKRHEQKLFKEQAEKLALMDPKKAAEFLLEFGVEGEDRAVKLLATMETESAAKILELMDAKRGARLLDRGLKLIREGAATPDK